MWVENRRIQREQSHEVRAPLLEIFRRRMLGNTIMACLWMASGFVIYYSVYGMFATHLQKDLHLGAGMVAMPIAMANWWRSWRAAFGATSRMSWAADGR